MDKIVLLIQHDIFLLLCQWMFAKDERHFKAYSEMQEQSFWKT